MRPFSAILFLLVGSFLWAWLHVADVLDINHHNEITTPPPVVDELPKVADLRLTYKKRSLIGDHEQFAFKTGSAKPTITRANKKFLDRVVKYMKDNPDAKLSLLGRYLPDDKNTSTYDNMGVARAASVREILVKKGIKEDRFDLRGLLVKPGQMNEPVSFEVIKDTFADMNFSDTNFETNSDVFKPGSRFVNWANEAKKYLTDNPSKKIVLIGHTDSDGELMYNQDLGLRRARAVRRYLVNMGIKNPISTDSKGETDPLTTNDTAANKRRNRRVNARIL